MKKLLITLYGALFLIILHTAAGVAVGQEAPRQILLLPFNVFAPQKYAYLKAGITATLNSRLKQPGITPIIPTEAMLKAANNLHSPLTKETIETIATALGADFAIEGNVTIVGQAVSTTIQLWDVPGGASRLNFHAEGDHPDAVIAHLDQFVGQLLAELSITPPQPVASTAASGQPTPEKPAAAPQVSWQSQRLETALKGLAIADLTPSPGREIAAIDNNDLLIYKRSGDALELITRIESVPYLRLIAVDAADINANGQAEIFVTAFHDRLGKPRSFVVEWDPSEEGFVKRFEDLPYYFRVLDIPSQGRRLIGQTAGLKAFFGKRPALMEWKSAYTMGPYLDLPPGTHIYEFALGAFMPDDKETIVTLTRRKRIEIYRNPEDLRWTSEDTYGGSTVYLDDSQTRRGQEKLRKQVQEETLKRTYLHPRMFIRDLDGDGVNELLVVHNEDATKGLFRRARVLTSGRVVCLDWEPLGPVNKWETPKISGYITDIDLADTNGDGRRELVYLVVDRQSKGLGKKQSYLVAHDLPAND